MKKVRRTQTKSKEQTKFKPIFFCSKCQLYAQVPHLDKYWEDSV